MLSGSLLNHRRRLSSGRGGSVFFGDDGVVSGALTRGWTHPGPTGLTPDAATRRVSCTALCPGDPQPGESASPDASADHPMVGVNSPTASSGAATAAGSSSSPNGGGSREQRVASKPFPPGLPSQTDSTPGKTEVDRILDQLTLSDETLNKIMALMNAEMDKGLHPDTQDQADIKMFPTYVRSIPDGSERGDFLALDLGGTNFRVLWVQIPPRDPKQGQSVGVTDLVTHVDEEEEEVEEDDTFPEMPPPRPDIKMKSRIFVIPPQIMQGPGEELFDHIVKCLAIFMDKERLLGKSLPLGFTFSFPLKQEGLAKGRLVTWTKGFSCAGVVGEDVVQLFHDAIKRYARTKNAKDGLEKVRCVAIVNDTTGTLMACAHKNPLCLAGLIFGTGSNACYVEKLKNVHTWDGDRDHPDEVLINTEWGAFGNGGSLDFILTDFDRDVDKHSVNRSKQIFEKLISGMYMGEIARLVLCRLYSLGALFTSCSSPTTVAQHDILKTLSPAVGGSSAANGASVPSLNPVASPIPEVLDWDKRGTFFTKYISEIESDRSEDYHVTKQVLDECGIRNVSIRECRLVKRICETVSTRAAHLASAGTAVLLNRMQRPHVTVGIDGSLYRFHPQFHNLMVQKIPDLSAYPFNLMLSEDGSGKGAALIAAVAHRMDHEL